MKPISIFLFFLLLGCSGFAKDKQPGDVLSGFTQRFVVDSLHCPSLPKTRANKQTRLIAFSANRVLGFFLKREVRKAAELDDRIKNLDVLMAKNEVRDSERWKVCNNVLEDRRETSGSTYKP